MNSSRLWLAPIFLLSIVAIAGCSPIVSSWRDPSIAVMDAGVKDASSEALVMQFTLDLANPNNIGLRLKDFEYDVSVNGVKVYSGLRAAEATLSSNDQRQLHIPAVVRYQQMGWTRETLPAVAHYDIRGTLQYITPGEIAQILLDTGVRKPRAGFSDTGEITLR